MPPPVITWRPLARLPAWGRLRQSLSPQACQQLAPRSDGRTDGAGPAPHALLPCGSAVVASGDAGSPACPDGDAGVARGLESLFQKEELLAEPVNRPVTPAGLQGLGTDLSVLCAGWEGPASGSGRQVGSMDTWGGPGQRSPRSPRGFPAEPPDRDPLLATVPALPVHSPVLSAGGAPPGWSPGPSGRASLGWLLRVCVSGVRGQGDAWDAVSPPRPSPPPSSLLRSCFQRREKSAG